jgi:hypothetical protein
MSTPKNMYVVGYDLHEEYDYSGIELAIGKLAASCRVAQTMWVVVTKRSTESLHDYLKAASKSPTSLVVIQLNTEAEWSDLDSDAERFMLQRFSVDPLRRLLRSMSDA